MSIKSRDPWEWTESELQSLIDSETPEAVTLEYKGSESLDKTDEKKREASKDISAMANSDGGVVIYGIQTYSAKGRKHVPEDFDKGIDPSQISIEWLEQVADSRIQPRIDGLRFQDIELKIARPRKFTYLVYVPKSNCAHQAADKRYHGRIERTTVALEDYQIRDINNRSKHPVLMPHFTLTTVGKGDGQVAYNFEIYLENTGALRARDWALELDIPRQITFKPPGTRDVILVDRKARTVQIRINPGASAQIIFPQDKQRVFIGHSWRIRNSDFDYLAEKGIISWKIFADDAPPQSDETRFSSIELNGEQIAETV